MQLLTVLVKVSMMLLIIMEVFLMTSVIITLSHDSKIIRAGAPLKLDLDLDLSTPLKMRPTKVDSEPTRMKRVFRIKVAGTSQITTATL